MQALLIIDLQNDFLPSGALPVPNGQLIIPVINQLQKQFSLVIASQEQHPFGHISFASTHGKKIGESIFLEEDRVQLWPDHCLQNSWGAEFPTELDSSKIQKIFFKGTDPKFDSYSAFFDAKNRRETGLFSYLQEKKVKQLFLVGLTLEYCVMATAIDSVRLGFETFVVLEGCRAINEIDGKNALATMQKEQVKILSVKELLSFTEKK